ILFRSYYCVLPVLSSIFVSFFFSSRRRHTRSKRDWSSDVCSSDLLHWGYNFWWSQFSLRPIDPFEETCAGGGFFGGDAFAVYPGPDGSAWLSIRHRVFAQAMADHRALTWL